MTQLMIGAVRIAVALMVMAAEIDVSMSVRIFEELTQTQPKPNGLFAVQMRSGLHILTGHPSGTKLWQRSYFFVKANNAAFEDPPDESFRLLIRTPSALTTPSRRTFRRWWCLISRRGRASIVRGSVANRSASRKVEGDHSTSEADGANDPTEVGLVGSIGAKRKEPTDGNFLRPGGKIQKRSRGPSPLSPKEIALPASRLLPWGGLSPPSDRFPLASSERWTFCHDKDSPFASDPDACAEFVRRIRGGAHLMPETSELAFPDGFIASAQADVESVVRKNQLILDYELSLCRMASNFAKAEAAIESKDAEIEKSKRVTLDKAKEMIAERSRYHREHKQDAEIIKGLEGELEAARSKIDRLEAEKTEEAEKTKRTMDHLRQVHRRELTSEMCCIGVAAADRFDKFRRYMVDRDKREEKLSGGCWKDILSANEAKFKEELEGVVVEGITDHNLTVSSLPRLERLQGSNQFGSNVGSNVEVADPAAACEASIQEIQTAGTIGAAVPGSIAED
ncbi:PREDICTED: uncharacterized protein LOC106320566 [Brassica oleracea var. oleracea]|uniref:uncharacterized protein LOC106320566 n=1 Tax=Brassica oleracea var. oleracea TaxID=109376 RepID=UPI0006A740F6|nr:PREDICTED: uncharacterized protein LOC106320566 [Brassica oleracea var. oleracea]